MRGGEADKSREREKERGREGKKMSERDGA